MHYYFISNLIKPIVDLFFEKGGSINLKKTALVKRSLNLIYKEDYLILLAS